MTTAAPTWNSRLAAMVPARNCRPERRALFLLLAVALLAVHSPAYPEWALATPPADDAYWEVGRVHFTSAREGWAVGYHYGAGRGAILHYREGAWTMVPPPEVSGQWGLYGVHFASPDDGWAVGFSRFHDGSLSGVLLHCQSGAWTTVTPPAMGDSWGLYGVHLTSADEGWAVGRVGRTDSGPPTTGALLHYRGDSWTTVTPPALAGNWHLAAVEFVSADEGWAVGSDGSAGVLLHCQTGTWTAVTPPALAGNWGLRAVHFTSADEGWAVGGGADGGVLLHYRRGSWSAVAPPTLPGNWYLDGVHSMSPDDGWAVGRRGTDYSNYEGVMLHCQSGTWAPVALPSMGGAWALAGVHFASADEGWAVGGDYVSLRGVLLRCTRALFPAEGTIGTQVTLTGQGFGSVRGRVLLSGLAMKVDKSNWSDEQIVFSITKAPPAGIPCSVSVVPRDQTGNILIPNDFYFRPPVLDPLAPDHGRPGTQIRVTGRFFGTPAGKVYIGDPATGRKRNCRVITWTMDPASGASTLTFVVPPLPGGLVPGPYVLGIAGRAGTVHAAFLVDP